MKHTANNILVGLVCVVILASFALLWSGNPYGDGIHAPIERRADMSPTAINTNAPEAHYCNAPTKSGQPCRRRVKAEGEHCFMHTAKGSN